MPVQFMKFNAQKGLGNGALEQSGFQQNYPFCWQQRVINERKTRNFLVLHGHMRQHKYALTEAKFEQLREKLEKRSGSERFEVENVEAAYAVMVKGETVVNVAKVTGQSRQNLHRVVRDLWAIFNDVEPPSRILQREKTLRPRTPRSWVRVAVTLPPDMAKSVQDLEAQARAGIGIKESKE